VVVLQVNVLANCTKIIAPVESARRLNPRKYAHEIVDSKKQIPLWLFIPTMTNPTGRFKLSTFRAIDEG
jgi:hypothetical protein